MALFPHTCHLLYNLFPKESYVSVTGKGYLLCFFKVCTLGSYTIKKYLFHSTGLWAGWVYRLQCRSVIGPIQWTELHIRKKQNVSYFHSKFYNTEGLPSQQFFIVCLLYINRFADSCILNFYYSFIYTFYHITVRLTNMHDSPYDICITSKRIFFDKKKRLV